MLQGIGLAFPGIVNPLSKKIIATNKKYDDGPQLNLAEWAAQKWNTALYIENDARMAAVGEWKFGAGRGSNDIVAVTIGLELVHPRLLRIVKRGNICGRCARWSFHSSIQRE
jgi:predicted NBD/HSP70 family sugar kinase